MSVNKFRFAAKAAFLSFSLLQTVLTSGCSSTKELTSDALSDNSYHIDGRSDKWKGKKMLNVKDAGLLLGVQHDAKNMYLCLMSDAAGTERQMAIAGVIVWFERDHGKKFGVHYPLPRTYLPAVERMYGYHTDMEILGPEKNDIAQTSVLTSEKDYGIATAFRDSAGVAVLEFQIPRAVQLEPYSTGIDTLVDVTIESAAIEHASGESRSGSMMGSGRHRRGGPSSGDETPTHSDPDIGQTNAGEKFSADPFSFHLRVHLTL